MSSLVSNGQRVLHFLLVVSHGRNGPTNIRLLLVKGKTEVGVLLGSILHGFLTLTEINNNIPAFIPAVKTAHCAYHLILSNLITVYSKSCIAAVTFQMDVFAF